MYVILRISVKNAMLRARNAPLLGKTQTAQTVTRALCSLEVSVSQENVEQGSIKTLKR